MKFEDVADTAEDTQNELSTGRNTVRDETQLAVDAKLASMATAWNESGKPSPSATHRYLVAKEDKTGLKQIVRRAARIAKVTPVFYKDTKPNDQGNVYVKFGIAALPVAESNGTAPTAPVAETPAQEIPTENEVQASHPEHQRRFARR